MRIYIPIPSLAPHGGIRVIVAIANGLAERGHHVRLHPLSICREDAKAHRFSRRLGLGPMGEMPERVLVTSPHSIHLAAHRRTVVHLQMMEDMFRPGDIPWEIKCRQTYIHPGRLLSISKWNIARLMNVWGRDEQGRGGATTYMGNGVDFTDFPLDPEAVKDPEPTVLVEGWNAYNPTKDVDRIAPRTCSRLRMQGVKVLAYGLTPPDDWRDECDEYHVRPSLETINSLYSRAWLLLKASKRDARSCSPVEAMTKGTPTVRVIEHGDDDLVGGQNATRLTYGKVQPKEVACHVMDLLECPRRIAKLAEAGFEHLSANCRWDPWIDVVEAALRDPHGTDELPGSIPWGGNAQHAHQFGHDAPAPVDV